MSLVEKWIDIDMGHRVTNHKSKCKNFHGHRYKVIVGVDDKVITTKGASDEGMVIDFGDIKTIMMDTIDAEYDHGFCLYDQDPHFETFREICEADGLKFIPVSFIPTAENLARHWYELLQPILKDRGIAISFVKVNETPTSAAYYSTVDEKLDWERAMKEEQE